ncbi:MAG: allantoinase AllB [Bacteroidota bacterium]
MSSKQPKEFAITSTRVVTPDGIREACVLVRDGRIAEVSSMANIPASVPTEDAGNLVVMAGLVDTHVHINEPGRTEWEGFETASKAAAAGGITTLVDMPLNSSPVTTTTDAFRKKLSAAEGKLWVDCGFYAGVIPGNTENLQPLDEAGVLGFKAFLVHSGIDEFPNATEQDLRAAMPVIAKTGAPLLVHCELQSNNPQFHQSPPERRRRAGNNQSYRNYLSSRPRVWEHDAIGLMVRLCKEFGCRTHVVHLSSADAVPMLQKARTNGLPITVETCPHYLYFSAEEIPDGDTRYKCAPPIRENENRERLWRALSDGVVDFIVSDHSPSTPELKLLNEGDFQKAWGGIASLQFGLSIVWTEARKRGFTMEQVADWMSQKPAAFVGLQGKKGAIAPGYDADIVVWDPEASYTVTPSMIHHRHKLTPYEERMLFGKVEGTYLRGQKIFESGAFDAKPAGQLILRGEPAQLSKNPTFS